MFEAKDILSLLGIPGAKIKSFDTIDDGDEATIFVELVDSRGCCPRCGSTSIEIKDYYTIRVNNSLIKHRHLTVEIRVRRYRCRKCEKTFKQEYELTERGASISNAVKGPLLMI